jgi:hypothetical protein
VPKTNGARPGGEIFWKNKILEEKKEKLKDKKLRKFNK